MADPSELCAICMQPLADLSDANERVEAWLCAHRYHSYCTSEYLRVRGGNPDDVPCPQCHITTTQALAMQQDFPRDPPSPTPTSSAGAADSDDDATLAMSPLADTAAANPPAMVGGPGKSKSTATAGKGAGKGAPPKACKGKGRGKGKSKATAVVDLDSAGPPPKAAQATAGETAKAGAVVDLEAKGPPASAGKAKAVVDLEAAGPPPSAGKAKAAGSKAVSKAKAKGKAAPELAPPPKKAGASQPKAKAAETAPPPKKAEPPQPKAKAKVGAAASAAAAASEADAQAGAAASEADAQAGAAALEAAAASEAEAQAGVGTPPPKPCPLLNSEEVFCDSCGRFQKFTKCRILSKMKGTWRCFSCQSKSVTLWRKLGSWPNETFAALSEDERRAFMAAIADKSVDDVMAAYDELMEKYEEHAEVYADMGEFLPLSVWKARGFDIESIEANSKPANVRTCPVLGLTYRVPILSSGHEGRKGKKRSSTATAAAKPGRQPKASGALSSSDPWPGAGG